MDYPRKGKRASPLPDWLHYRIERSSKRSTFVSWNHYSKKDKLKTSGLLGPVKINISVKKTIIKLNFTR